MSSSIILEKLSNKQLILLLIGNVVIMLLFFIVGGKGPRPTNAMTRSTKTCNDNIQKFEKHTQPIDDDSCSYKIESIAEDNPRLIGNNIVFYAVLPTDQKPDIRMSRWFQWMIGILNIKPLQDVRFDLPDKMPVLTFKGAIFGRDNPSEIWHLVHEVEPTATHSRRLHCWTEPTLKIIECGDAALFELGSVFYQYYLINVQLPERDNLNSQIPRLRGIDIIEIHQNGGYTMIYTGQKAVLCPVLLAVTMRFMHQVKQCDSSPLLISRVIGALGIVNVIFNVPLEYISLFADVPQLRVWYDCSSGMFYAATAVLWLLFVGEHRMDLDQRNKFSNYWKEITAICICCIVMFLFDVIERGFQVSDPFHTVWSSRGGENAARAMLILTAVCAAFYFLVLLYLMVRAVLSMSRKRASLANVGRVRQLYYEGLIFRFKVMVYGTVLCGLVTVVLFILVNLNEMYYKWGKPPQNIEISSGFLAAVSAVWNLYVLNILVLYAPVSDKSDNDYESVEMTEVGVKPAAQDALKTLTKPAAE